MADAARGRPAGASSPASTTIDEVVRETVLDDEVIESSVVESSDGQAGELGELQRLGPLTICRLTTRQRQPSGSEPCRPSSSKRWTPPAARSRTPIDAANEEEAQQKIRQMGYFVTKLTEVAGRQEGKGKKKKAGKQQEGQGLHHRRRLAASSSCTFTRQFSTLQDAGLPVLRSLQDPRRPDEAGRAQERPHRRRRRRRVRQHALARRSASTPSASTGSTSTWSRPARPAAPSKSSCSAWPTSRRRPRASSGKIIGAMVYPVVVIFVAVAHPDASS